MTVELFLILFTVCEIITPLVTEGIKKALAGLNKQFNSTLLALIVAIVVSTFASMFMITKLELGMNTMNIYYIVLLCGSNWLGSTLGYDKMKEALTKITR